MLYNFTNSIRKLSHGLNFPMTNCSVLISPQYHQKSCHKMEILKSGFRLWVNLMCLLTLNCRVFESLMCSPCTLTHFLWVSPFSAMHSAHAFTKTKFDELRGLFWLNKKLLDSFMCMQHLHFWVITLCSKWRITSVWSKPCCNKLVF